MVPATVSPHTHRFRSSPRGIGDNLPFIEWRENATRRARGLENNAVDALSPRAVTDVVVDGENVVTGRRLRHVPLDENQARVGEFPRDWQRA